VNNKLYKVWCFLQEKFTGFADGNNLPEIITVEIMLYAIGMDSQQT